jgi:hypothetical protein
MRRNPYVWFSGIWLTDDLLDMATLPSDRVWSRRTRAGRARSPVFGPHVSLSTESGEHDGQVGLDGVTLAVVDHPSLEIGFGHAERLPSFERLAVRADHEFRGRRRAVGQAARLVT